MSESQQQSIERGHATIYDVAQRVGVSHATVYRAMKNTGRINADTREKILNAAKEMGYQPSMVGQMLANRRTQTLGVLVPGMGDTPHFEIVRAIEQAAFAKGYSVILCNTSMSPKKRHAAIDMLIRRRVEGVVIIPFDRSIQHDTSDIDKLDAAGIPLVMVAEEAPENRCDTVCPDFRLAIRGVVDHIVSLGHRRIGYFYASDRSWDLSERDRFAGYREGLLNAGIEFEETLCLQSGTPDEVEERTYNEKLVVEYVQRADRPTAIVCTCDMLAIKVLRTLHQLNTRIPHEMSVAGVGNIMASSVTFPSLTTYAQPAETTGQEAFSQLLARINGEANGDFVHKRIEGKLVVRESCVAFES